MQLEDEDGKYPWITDVEKQEGRAIGLEIADPKPSGGPKIHDCPKDDTQEEVLPRLR